VVAEVVTHPSVNPFARAGVALADWLNHFLEWFNHCAKWLNHYPLVAERVRWASVRPNRFALPARLLLVAVALAGAAARARAETYCSSTLPSSPGLIRIDAETRLAFIRHRLHRAQRRTKWWAGAWIGIYGALTISNVVGLAVSKTDGDRIDWGLSFGATAVGLLSVGAMPMPTLWDINVLERHIAAGEPICSLVAEAEWRMKRDADAAAFNTSFLAHLFNFALNVGIGAGLVAIGHFEQAALYGLGGLAVGELQIVTTPTDVIQAYRRYKAGFLDDRPLPPPLQWALVPQASHGRYTMNVALSF
jgi:hypothetical protein